MCYLYMTRNVLRWAIVVGHFEVFDEFRFSFSVPEVSMVGDLLDIWVEDSFLKSSSGCTLLLLLLPYLLLSESNSESERKK